MSKSLGNVARVHDLLNDAPGEALRWALAGSHYRQPLAWTDDVLVQAKGALDRLYGALRRVQTVEAEAAAPSDAFMEALLDDLNTPRANAELFAIAKALETAPVSERGRLKGQLLASGRLMGFLQADPETWFHAGVAPELSARIEALVAARVQARRAKDFASADEIRRELTAMGVEVMDSATGATWRREPA